MLEESWQQAFIYFASACDPTAAIELLPAPRHEADDAVDHHVPGSRIERADRLERAACREIRQVANPADVDDGSRTRGMAKEQEMEIGGKRRAFPTGRHVPASKVGHRGEAGPLGDDGRRAQLQGGPDRPDDRFAPRL